jgi:hypothetical protein
VTDTTAAETAPITSVPELAPADAVVEQSVPTALGAESVDVAATATAAEVVVPEDASTGVSERAAVVAPEEVAVGASEAVVVATSVAAAKPARRKAVRTQVSDETLAAWQAKLAATRAAKERARKTVQSSGAEARIRADVFRTLRQLVHQGPGAAGAAAVDPELQALADDALACQVHQAPAHIRQVITATLALLGGKRRGRPPRR